MSLEKVMERVNKAVEQLKELLERRKRALKEAIATVLSRFPEGLPVTANREVYRKLVSHSVGVPTYTVHYYYLHYDPNYGLTVRYNHSWSGRGAWIVPVDDIQSLDALKAVVKELPSFIKEVVDQARAKGVEADEALQQLKQAIANL